jgi:hypothetical protein
VGNFILLAGTKYLSPWWLYQYLLVAGSNILMPTCEVFKAGSFNTCPSADVPIFLDVVQEYRNSNTNAENNILFIEAKL